MGYIYIYELTRYGELLMHGLTQQDNNNVLLLILKQMSRWVLNDDLAILVTERDFLRPVLDMMDIEVVASEVTNWVVLLADTTAGLSALTTPEVVAQLLGIASRSSVLQVRVLDMIVRVSTLGEEHLLFARNSGFLEQLFKMLETEDFKVKLNCVDLLATMALAPHGLKYIDAAGLLNTMSSMLENCIIHPNADILLPALVKFWGNLAYTRPNFIMTQYPGMPAALVNMIKSDDHKVQTAAFETIGIIGVSLEGKITLEELKVLEHIEKLEILIRDSHTEVKIRALNALASLIKLDKADQNLQMLCTTQAWYMRVSNTMNMVTNIVKQSSIELRLAAYQLLCVMANQPWGREIIFGHPGFAQFLMEEKEERDLICTLVHIILESRDTEQVSFYYDECILVKL